jgi:hypothetical protein
MERPSRVVAFLFNDHTQNLTIDDLLGSLLRQLIFSLPLSPVVVEWWDGSREPLNTGKLNQMLISQIQSAPDSLQVDLLSDAFDECGPRTQLLHTFRTLVQTGKVRICTTSRPNHPESIQQSDHQIYVVSKVEDIQKFVAEQIKSLLYRFSGLLDLLQDAKPEGGQVFCDYVISKVVEMAGGR